MVLVLFVLGCGAQDSLNAGLNEAFPLQYSVTVSNETGLTAIVYFRGVSHRTLVPPQNAPRLRVEGQCDAQCQEQINRQTSYYRLRRGVVVMTVEFLESGKIATDEIRAEEYSELIARITSSKDSVPRFSLRRVF